MPIGIQDFTRIREEGYIYIDKTPYIHRLITGSGSTFFLSRPRRFGKSLLLSAMEAFFKGKKDLFTGLYIYDKTDWNISCPVIKLDWTAYGHCKLDGLESGMIITLGQIGKSYQVDLEINKNAADVFRQLISALHKKTGRKVVVLIDEYDVPILDNLKEADEVVEPIREFLQGFYRILKVSDEHLQFVFLTGITKFAKVSVFSALNNLMDITLDKEYSAICGLTQLEIETNFESRIDHMAKEHDASGQEVLEAIRYWYNGFSWDGDVFVYNPFSTLLLFEKKIFQNYWFSTATPTFLIDIIKKRNDVKCVLGPSEINDLSLNLFDYKTLDTKMLLFQTGYLTVKSVRKGQLGVPPVYTIDVPNNEVRNALLEYLVSSYAEYTLTDTAILRDRMRQQLLDGDEAAFESGVMELFAGIPYQLHIPREAYYHSLLLLWLNMLGFEVQGEISTNKGRIDALWLWEDQVIIAEVKYANEGDCEQLVKSAFDQIYEKDYYERYKGNHRKITLLAVAFAGKAISCKMIKP